MQVWIVEIVLEPWIPVPKSMNSNLFAMEQVLASSADDARNKAWDALNAQSMSLVPSVYCMKWD